MNPPASNESAGLNLPPPMPAELPSMPLSGSPEAAPASAEKAPAVQVSPAGSLPPVNLPVPPQLSVQAVQPVAGSTTNTVVPNTADDVDLIEKEWVQKAKQIISKTQDNPYEQSKEINTFKADYMKKRYNKTLKLSE